MKKYFVALVALLALGLPAAAAVATSRAELREDDVKLFRVKCGLCHGVNKTFAAFPGMSAKERAGVVEEMAGKKDGWISDPERAAITALLSTNDLAGLAAAIERPRPAAEPTPVAEPTSPAAPSPIAGPKPVAEQRPAAAPSPSGAPAPVAGQTPDEAAGEARIEVVSIAHGVLQAAVFFALGIAMALSGLKRFFDRKKILPRFPGAFVWPRHVLKGKITIACALGGLCAGLAILALDGFSIGARTHFWIGCAVGVLFAVGGLAGLHMARGKGTPALRRAHLVCNLTATILFAVNVVSGLSLAYLLIG